MKTIPMYPKKVRILTPKEFLNLTSDQRNNIKVAKIVPPRLGKWDLGKILVEYKSPIYEASEKDAR